MVHSQEDISLPVFSGEERGEGREEEVGRGKVRYVYIFKKQCFSLQKIKKKFLLMSNFSDREGC